MLRGRPRAPVFGRPLHVRALLPNHVRSALPASSLRACSPAHRAQDFPGQPQLVKDILLRLKGSLCHKDLFLVMPSARTLEKIALMRKVGRSRAAAHALSLQLARTHVRAAILTATVAQAWDAGTCPLRLAGVQDADAVRQPRWGGRAQWPR